MWPVVASQDVPTAASNVTSFTPLPTIPGSPLRKSKAAPTSTSSFHTAEVSPLSSVTQQQSVTSEQLISLTNFIEALKKEKQKQKEDFDRQMEEHQALVHDALIDGQEKLACYVKAVVNMSMKISHTAFAYDLSRTANIFNTNMNQIGNMLSALSHKPYLPLELPSPDIGPRQEGSRILSEAVIKIERIPLPIPNNDGKSESQSSFDPHSPVIEVCNSKDLLDNMDDGEEQIELEPAVGEKIGV